MSTAPRLRQLLILVRDVPRSIHFYGPGGLGLPLLEGSSSDYAELESGESVLGLRRAQKEAELCKGYSPFLCFDVQDVDELVSNLVSKGAVLDGGVKREADGKFAALRCPDGVTIGLREVLFDPRQVELMNDADEAMNRKV